MAGNHQIRHAQPEDVPTIFFFLQAAAAEQSPGTSIPATEARLAAAIQFDRSGQSAPPVPCYLRVLLIVSPEGDVAGMAMYYFNYSTWNARLGLVLEELYVALPFRGRGYAKNLIEALAVVANENDCTQMNWLCLKENAPALKLYEAVGAKARDWAVLRVDEEGIKKLMYSSTEKPPRR